MHRDDVEMKGYDEVNGPVSSLLFSILEHILTAAHKCIGCSIIGIIPGMPCFMQMLQRRQLRKQLDIAGNFGNDCVMSFFCHCCGVVQEDIEARKWQQRQGVYANTKNIEEPQQEPGMEYSAVVQT